MILSSKVFGKERKINPLQGCWGSTKERHTTIFSCKTGDVGPIWQIKFLIGKKQVSKLWKIDTKYTCVMLRVVQLCESLNGLKNLISNENWPHFLYASAPSTIFLLSTGTLRRTPSFSYAFRIWPWAACDKCRYLPYHLQDHSCEPPQVLPPHPQNSIWYVEIVAAGDITMKAQWSKPHHVKH